MWGYYRVAAAVPSVRLGDAEANAEIIGELYAKAAASGCAVVVFPELAVTGCSCGDLFDHDALPRQAWQAAQTIADRTGAAIAIFGLPLLLGDALFNAVAVAQHGAIRLLVLKAELTAAELRVFTPGACCAAREFEGIPVGCDWVLHAGDDLVFGVEIGGAAESPCPPAGRLSTAGARAIFRPAADVELPGSRAIRREMVCAQSRRQCAAYLSCSAGTGESTTDQVFSGHALIAADGRLLAENAAFLRHANLLSADVDFRQLAFRRRSGRRGHAVPGAAEAPRHCTLEPAPEAPDLAQARLNHLPFVPPAGPSQTEHCMEIIDLQCAGLQHRMHHVKAEHLVLGISGGLDSTLALLVAARCCERLELPPERVLAVTMPGFGTTDRTYRNAVTLCEELGVTMREIAIRDACLGHFRDIGHPPTQTDTTYENAQARERTQILMDLANRHNGLVVGTGDLSEIALGWSTFNGDHMSMYAVNATVPKTLIPYLLAAAAHESGNPRLQTVLEDVAATPVSPELLPPHDDGRIAQVTEALIGSYELHDFFLYHLMRDGAEPDKLAYLARTVFAARCDAAEIDRVLKIFLQRFRRQQFKRNCMPDGAQAGPISLSPRGAWQMPSDLC